MIDKGLSSKSKQTFCQRFRGLCVFVLALSFWQRIWRLVYCERSMGNPTEADLEVSNLLRDLVQKDGIEELFPDLGPIWEDGATSPDTTMIDNVMVTPVKMLSNTPLSAAKPQVMRNLMPVQNQTDIGETSKPCKSKNAVAARENRLKKKKHLEELEKSNEQKQAEIEELKQKLRETDRTSRDSDRTIRILRDEVQYLRSVLANVPEISDLIKSIRSTKVGSSLACPSLKRAGTETQGPAPKATRTTRSISSVGKQQAVGGVCLHVVNGQVSLEFCPQCSSSAARFRLPQQSDDEQPQ